jgi:PKD repeat protein
MAEINRKKVQVMVCVVLITLTLASSLCISSDEPEKIQNNPPTVLIKADITTGEAPLSISFRAEADDPDGFVESFDWDFGDGASSSKEKVVYTYYNPGNYEVSLTVYDNLGEQANDTLNINVKEIPKANEPPTATAAVDPEMGYEGEFLTFRGIGSDSDGTIILFEWDFNSDGIFDWFSNTTGITQFAYNESGKYNPIFRVIDDDLDSDSATAQVTIFPKENDPPVAIISQPESGMTFEVDEEIPFDGSESFDPEDESLSYAWEFGDGDIALEAKPTHTYSETGNYTVILTVDDGEFDNSDTITLQIIRLVNHPPEAEIVEPTQDSAFEVNTIIFFDGSNSTDPDDDFLYYYWDFGDGNTKTGVTTTHIYTQVGTYTVILTVDDGELTDTDNVRILITEEGSLNQPPEAVINEPQNGENFTVDEVITFDGSNSTDPDHDTLNYTWDFKDGSIGYGEVTTYSYSENGTYNVTLTVFDGQYSDTANVVIIIGPGVVINTPPTAVISEPTMLSSFETNQTVNFAGYQSFDPDDDDLSYDWDFGDGSEHTHEENTTHRYTAEGIYFIQLTVSDGVYNDTDSVLISIVEGTGNNSGPTAEIVSPTTGEVFDVDEVITFDGSNSSDPDGDALTYSWTFGDGTQGSGVKTTHRYSAPGFYTVILVVSDGELNDTDRVNIIVRFQIRSSTNTHDHDDPERQSNEKKVSQDDKDQDRTNYEVVCSEFKIYFFESVLRAQWFIDNRL